MINWFLGKDKKLEIKHRKGEDKGSTFHWCKNTGKEHEISLNFYKRCPYCNEVL